MIDSAPPLSLGVTTRPWPYSGFVDRAIAGFHADEEGDWVAELSCGHRQHVRHQPPFQLRPWVLDSEGRSQRIGAPLDCLLCERAELPGGLHLVRTSPQWENRTVPAGLLHTHRLGEGTWGLIRVRQGTLQFVMQSNPVLDIRLGPHSVQAIPPGVPHHVKPLGPVRFSIDFLAVDGQTRVSHPRDRGVPETGHDSIPSPIDDGGDPACWSGSVCPECGVVVGEGSHRRGCQGNAAF